MKLQNIRTYSPKHRKEKGRGGRQARCDGNNFEYAALQNRNSSTSPFSIGARSENESHAEFGTEIVFVLPVSGMGCERWYVEKLTALSHAEFMRDHGSRWAAADVKAFCDHYKFKGM